VGIEGIKKIKKRIQKTIVENQMLLRNTKCNFKNSKFKIELTNELPVFTKQYPISERMLGKVAERVKK
jgi:hypothetical protein